MVGSEDYGGLTTQDRPYHKRFSPSQKREKAIDGCPFPSRVGDVAIAGTVLPNKDVVCASIVVADSVEHVITGKTCSAEAKVAATSLVSLVGSMANQPASPKSVRHRSISRENTSSTTGSMGIPSTHDADLSRTVLHCSVFGTPGEVVSEVDKGGLPTATESLGKHVDRGEVQMKTDVQGRTKAGNGYDSISCSVSLSKKEYSRQVETQCNPGIPANGVLETTNASEVVETRKRNPGEQSLVLTKAGDMV